MSGRERERERRKTERARRRGRRLARQMMAVWLELAEEGDDSPAWKEFYRVLDYVHAFQNLDGFDGGGSEAPREGGGGRIDCN